MNPEASEPTRALPALCAWTLLGVLWLAHAPARSGPASVAIGSLLVVVGALPWWAGASPWRLRLLGALLTLSGALGCVAVLGLAWLPPALQPLAHTALLVSVVALPFALVEWQEIRFEIASQPLSGSTGRELARALLIGPPRWTLTAALLAALAARALEHAAPDAVSSSLLVVWPPLSAFLTALGIGQAVTVTRRLRASLARPDAA